jgi:hypothetical protein
VFAAEDMLILIIGEKLLKSDLQLFGVTLSLLSQVFYERISELLIGFLKSELFS